MKYDILFAGVGGQGVLSMAAVIGRAAVSAGLQAKQSEVHGMAQRGGAVLAHLRLADHAIESDLIPHGGAELVLSLEPLEALRHVVHLAPGGALVTAAEPFTNIPDYPPLESLHEAVRRLPRGVVIAAEPLATAAGDVETVNTVMVGAASPFLPLPPGDLEEAIRHMYARKGEAVVRMNLAAFRAGRESAGAVPAHAGARA